MNDARDRISILLDALDAEEVCLEERKLERYAIDGLRPSTLLRPRSMENLRSVMRIASEVGLAVVPVGNALDLASLNPPGRYDVALSLEKLDRIVEYDADNFFVRVEAGSILSSLNEALARQRQRLPLDVSRRRDPTIGGLMSVPFVGPRYPFSGAPRDVALGLAAVLPGGKLVRAGGVTAKNVAGYDLTRLLVGSCGSLGVIAEVNLRTAPLPEDSGAIGAHFEDPARAFEFARAIAASDLRPSFATVLCGLALGEGEFRASSCTSVLLGAEGFRKDVAWQLGRLRGAAEEAGASKLLDELPSYHGLLEAMHDAAAGVPGELVVRVSATMAQLSRFAHLKCEASTIAFVPAGVIVVRARTGTAERVLGEIDATCREANAHRHVISAPDDLKRSIDAWSDRRASRAIMRSIKREFDPAGILSPGRMPGFL